MPNGEHGVARGRAGSVTGMAITRLMRVAARALTGYGYVTMGYDTFRHPGGRVAVAASTLDSLRTVVPIPDDDELLVRGTGLTQLTAGALLAVGIAPRLMAATLAGTLVPITVAAHSYWTTEDPAERAGQQVHFRKNVALLGGLLFCVAGTRGRGGRRRTRRRRDTRVRRAVTVG